MRSRSALFAVALLLLTVAAPGIEGCFGALAAGPAESPDQRTCSDEVCCSCCVHVGPLFVSLPIPAPPDDRVGTSVRPHELSLPADPPSRILHVPKLSAA